MKVSVIICSIGRKTLFDCLESLINQDFQNFEVLVVSFEKSIEKKVEEYDAKFIFSPKANVSFQRNLGIKKSKGKLICFIDDDAIADPSWIKNLIKPFRDRRVGCSGGRIELMFECKIPEELKKIAKDTFRGFLGGTSLGEERKEIKKPLLWGSNICFRRKIFDYIGYFDERIGRTPTLPLCNEEIEIQERILSRGFKIVYEPKALVWHRVFSERLTLSYFLERAFWQGYSEAIGSRRYKAIKNFIKNNKAIIWGFLMKEKMFENMFEVVFTKDLNEKILRYKKIGRIVGFLDLAKGE